MSTLLPFPQNNGQIDHHFSKDGTALTKEQRIARAERKGLCSRCGIRTHKLSFGRRIAMTNDHVHDGHCIKCDPDMVPLKVCVDWEERNPDQISLAKRTQFHKNRGAHRQSLPGSSHTIPQSDLNMTQPEAQSLRNSTSSFSADRCSTCGIQTHETKVVKSKRTAFLGKRHKETQMVPLTIENAVLAGRCLLCHPLPHRNSMNGQSPPPRQQQEEGHEGTFTGQQGLHPLDVPDEANKAVAEESPIATVSSHSLLETEHEPQHGKRRLSMTERTATERTHEEEEPEIHFIPESEAEDAPMSTSRDPPFDLKLEAAVSQFADPGEEVEFARRDDDTYQLDGEEAHLSSGANSDSPLMSSVRDFEATVGVAFGEATSPSGSGQSAAVEIPQDELDAMVSPSLSPASNAEEKVDVDESIVREEVKDNEVLSSHITGNGDNAEAVLPDDSGAAASVPGSIRNGVPESIQIQPPTTGGPGAAAADAAAAAAVALESGANKEDQYERSAVAIAQAVLVASSTPDQAVQLSPDVVPVDINLEDSGEMEGSEDPDRTNWPAPWPLYRSTDADDDRDSSDSGVDIQIDVDGDSAVSSLNFTTAEDLLVRRRSSSSFRDRSVVDRSTTERSMADKSMTERSISIMERSMSMMADSSLQRSARKLEGSSKTFPDASLGTGMDGMSNSQMQATASRNSNSKALSSANSLMAEMLHTGDLLGWLQDFAAECRESDQFRAEAAERGGIVAVISALKLNKMNVGIQQEGCLALNSLAKDHGALIAKQGGINCLLSAIKHHGQEAPQVQEYACGSLVYVAMNDSYKALVARKGGISSILAAMQRHINYLTVQQQCCAALLRLSSHRDVVDMLAHAKYKGIRTVVESMKRNRDDRLLQQYASGILKNIAQKETARSALSRECGVTALVEAINWHKDCENLQQQASWALYEISASQNIAQDGVIGAVISAMEGHKENAKVQQYGCGVLKHLSVTKKNIYSVAKLKGIATILDAMQNHVDNAALQRCACGALKHLSLSSTNERAIARMGGIRVIVEVMKAHKIDGTVQREACGALRNLSINDGNKCLIAEHGGVVTILVAMKLNRNDESLQQKACGTLLNLSSNAELRRTISTYGGVIAVVAIMKHLPSDAKVQQYACGTIKNLAVSPELKKTIAQNEGILAILQAMKRHSSEAKLQSCACGALKNLAANTDNKEEITKHKGVVAIISAMKQHVNDASVQQEGCAALLVLSVVKETSVSIGKHGGIHAILQGMKRHFKISSVQSSACGALWNLSASSSNMAIIYKNLGINMIVSGMKMHVTVSNVQHKACLALANMTGSETYRAAILKMGGIAAAIDAMKCHVRDAHVQKYACRFLASMLQTGELKKEVAKGASAVRVALEFHSDNDDLKKHAHKILVAVSFREDGHGHVKILPPPITSIEC